MIHNVFKLSIIDFDIIIFSMFLILESTQKKFINKIADKNSVFQKLCRVDTSNLFNFSSQNFSVLSHNYVFHAHNNSEASQLISHLLFYDIFLIYKISTKTL